MTIDTEKALLTIYCQYKKRLGLGTTEKDARYFEDAKLRKIDNFTGWDRASLNIAIQELNKNGYISMNILDDVKLLDKGISYVESKPKEYFDTFLNVVSGLASVIGSFF